MNPEKAMSSIYILSFAIEKQYIQKTRGKLYLLYLRIYSSEIQESYQKHIPIRKHTQKKLFF